jgi:hypothetical protein
MQNTLTAAQCTQINNAAHTHNYSAAAVAEWEATQVDVCDKYTQLFETTTNVLAAAAAHDIGGLIVYFATNNVLVAFYDYENFVGAIFVMQTQQQA